MDDKQTVEQNTRLEQELEKERGKTTFKNKISLTSQAIRHLK